MSAPVRPAPRAGADVDRAYALAGLGVLAGLTLLLDAPDVSFATLGVAETFGAALALALVALAPAAAGWRRLVALVALSLGAAGTLMLIRLPGLAGAAPPGLILAVAALWIAAGRLVVSLARIEGRGREGGGAEAILVPILFGLWIVYLWEMAVIGFGVPRLLLPAPSVIAGRFAGSLDILAADVVQTVFKAVAAGYAIGCGSGFLLALLVDRMPFLKRGLLPFGNLVSALPIVGIAPIMVMWFGFDWPSKAAVVVVMTFFPMLVNTVAGLQASGRVERDIMRSYAASHRQTLLRLRLPAAMPFIFNALKINSTLALIGAIVAEFFGTPIVGMGFRISTEVGRMNIDMVWAEIAAAAVIGSLLYGFVALVERGVTFWHPSYRR